MENQFIWNCIFAIGMAACGWFITLGGKLLKEIQENFAAQIVEHDKKIIVISSKQDEQGKAQHNFELYVQRNFVSKDEHLYSTERLTAKMDLIQTALHKIDKNITRIAALQGVEDDE